MRRTNHDGTQNTANRVSPGDCMLRGLLLTRDWGKPEVGPEVAERVRMGYLPITSDASFFVVVEKGFSKAQGLLVEPVKFETSNQALEALVAGRWNWILRTSRPPWEWMCGAARRRASYARKSGHICCGVQFGLYTDGGSRQGCQRHAQGREGRVAVAMITRHRGGL